MNVVRRDVLKAQAEADVDVGALIMSPLNSHSDAVYYPGR